MGWGKGGPPAVAGCWEERLKKRCERMPLAYVLGKTEFMGLPFLVEPGVLIPRQDTETLVEWVLREERAGLSVVDMCAGSGCIGLSLEKLGGFDVTLCDLSPQARAAALRNREALALRAAVCGGDLFAGLPQGMRCDVIVSNPPYIASEVIASLQPSSFTQVSLFRGRAGAEAAAPKAIMATLIIFFIKM